MKNQNDSSSSGLSLNDHLEKGPNYINSLPNILMLLRMPSTLLPKSSRHGIPITKNSISRIMNGSRIFSATDGPEHFSKSCLALLAHLWDPVGLIAPVTIKFRIQLQELWNSGLNHWDDILPEGVQQKWMENVEAMNHLLTFEVDRKLSNSVCLPEIHGFCDGGELAYWAVIFLRWTLEDGSYHCVPFMVKPFVAPERRNASQE